MVGQADAVADPAASLCPQRVAAIVGETATALERLGRTDLSARVARAHARLGRRHSVVCVVGEFKQGKSALVNSLCGVDVCPVDDDVATATPTWLYAAARPEARVRLVADGERSVEDISVDRIAEFAIDDGRPDGPRVELVEVGHPSEVLEQGLSIVDMPGAGGVQSGRTTAVLGFLPNADALLFVSDASAELSAPELEFLRSAAEVCPTVLVALTKIDLYGHWRRIAELDAGHLQNWGIEASGIVPISADLCSEARRRDDPGLLRESGIPTLRRVLQTQVLQRARHRACATALGEVRTQLRDLTSAARAQQQALEDPARAEALVTEMEAAREKNAELRKAGSRWSTVLADGFSDLIARQEQGLRTEIRTMTRETDERLEAGSPAAEWRGLVADLQNRVARLAGEMAAENAARTEELARRVAEMIGDTPPGASAGSEPETVDVSEFWERGSEELSAGPGRAATVLAAVRGGSSGVVMLGIVGSLAGMALASPVALGAGVVFGAKQLVEDRKKKAELQRREARTIVQQYLRQVQVELGTHDRRAIQENHRMLRDHFVERIAELDRTSRRAAEELQKALQAERAGQQQRLEYLQASIALLDGLLERAEALAGELPGTGAKS